MKLAARLVSIEKSRQNIINLVPMKRISEAVELADTAVETKIARIRLGWTMIIHGLAKAAAGTETKQNDGSRVIPITNQEEKEKW